MHRGSGVIGITRAFVAAGAPTLLATLWKVDDAATRTLMQRFYRRLLGDAARDAAAALQGTMIAMIRDGFKTKEWASFVCYGLASAQEAIQHSEEEAAAVLSLQPAAPSGQQSEGSFALTAAVLPAAHEHALRAELEDLLSTRNLTVKLEEAVGWFDRQGYESIDEMLEAKEEQQFISALQIKPGKAKLLAMDLLKRRTNSADRASAPSIHDLVPHHVRDALSTSAAEPLEMADAARFAERVTHGRNRTVPPDKWGLTVRQFKQFVGMCQRDTAKWAELAASTDRNKPAGVVNAYQICEHFVKPFTRGTGCGVALLLNPTAPLEAEMMMSHVSAHPMPHACALRPMLQNALSHPDTRHACSSPAHRLDPPRRRGQRICSRCSTRSKTARRTMAAATSS